MMMIIMMITVTMRQQEHRMGKRSEKTNEFFIPRMVERWAKGAEEGMMKVSQDDEARDMG